MWSVLIALVFMIGTVFSSNGQVNATATTTATIVTPIMISKTVDMNFGNIAVGSIGGTVVLSPAGSRTKTGDIVLTATAGTVTSASFTVTGMADYAYNITLPTTNVIITKATGSETMIVNSFVSTPSANGILSAEFTNPASQIINVGATLIISPNQTAGVYVSNTPFAVTVNYN